MAKMKVSELPKEEMEKLIAEAKELDVRGVATCSSWAVETLEAKIAEAKNAKAAQGGEQTPPGENENDAQDGSKDEQNGGENEQETGEREQNDGENEQETGEREQNDGENEQETGEREQGDKEVIVAGDGGVHQIPPENEAQDAPQDEKQDEETEEEQDETPPGAVKKATKQTSKKATICHICRSKVIDGECQGCGFKVVR